MTALEIEFHCLCFFVPDPEKGTVHVLMPRTHAPEDHDGHGAAGQARDEVGGGDGGDAGDGESGGDGGDGESGGHLHVVRMFHESFDEVAEGRAMEGFTLVLGPESGAADTSLRPERPRAEEIVDLAHATGMTLGRELIEDFGHPGVVSRVILRSGYIREMDSDTTWTLRRRDIDMAYKVVWRIDGITEEQVRWVPESVGERRPPFARLAELGDRRVQRLRIAHMTPDAMPPGRRGTLSDDAVREHFRAFYALYGITNPSDDQLPTAPERVDNVNCPTAGGSVKPPPRP